MPVFETLGQQSLEFFVTLERVRQLDWMIFVTFFPAVIILFYCIVFHFFPFIYFAESNFFFFYISHLFFDMALNDNITWGQWQIFY